MTFLGGNKLSCSIGETDEAWQRNCNSSLSWNWRGKGGGGEARGAGESVKWFLKNTTV